MEPQLYEISFFAQFSCQMGDCPYTCCRGWRIVFDDETYYRYLKEPGRTGFRLRSSIMKMDGEVYFRASLKQCTFYETSGTCQIQRTLGTDYMPLVCRRYPRFWQHYGVFAEEALFLSCPEAARLFLVHLDELHYVPCDRPITYERWGTNEDVQYLEWLRQLRGAMIEQIWDKSRSRAEIFGQLNAAMKEIQKGFLEGKELPDIQEILQTHKNQPPLILTSRVTDEMLTNGFYHTKLRKVSPILYQLCRQYFLSFDRLDETRADARAGRLRSNLYAAHPQLEQVLRGYAVYGLLLFFLEVYEDYSFVKKLGAAIMHVHMLELFLGLYYEQKKSLTTQELSVLIAVYDRRGRHNEDVAQGMYEKLYPALEAAREF